MKNTFGTPNNCQYIQVIKGNYSNSLNSTHETISASF